MKKTITVSGARGTLTGWVEIEMDMSKRSVTFHNRGTHEEETKQVSVHKVKAYHNGKVVFESQDIIGKSNIPAEAALIEKALKNYLDNLANSKYVDVHSQLSNLGYK